VRTCKVTHVLKRRVGIPREEKGKTQERYKTEVKGRDICVLGVLVLLMNGEGHWERALN